MAANSTVPRWIPVAALFFVTLAWGGTFVWMKETQNRTEDLLGQGVELAGTAWFMGLRFALAALLLALWKKARFPWGDRATWRGGFWLGVFLWLGFVLQMLGLTEVSPAVSAFLTSLYVLFTALLTAALTRRAPSRWLVAGVVLATLGAGIIRGRPELGFTLGELQTVGCALVFAAHILVTDGVTKRVSPLPATLASFAWVAALSFATFGAAALFEPAPALDRWVELALDGAYLEPLLLSSVLATVVALSLMNLYQRELDPVRAAVLYALEPIWAAAFGIHAGHDSFTPWLVAGGTILFAGNLVAELGGKKPPASSAQA
jgi:drug/metabolite transporter (DMT)-like permease